MQAFDACFKPFHLRSIYVTGLVAKWVKENGGLEEFERRSKAKAGCLYELIDNSSGFYTYVSDVLCAAVMQKSCGSV